MKQITKKIPTVSPLEEINASLLVKRRQLRMIVIVVDRWRPIHFYREEFFLRNYFLSVYMELGKTIKESFELKNHVLEPFVIQ